LDQKVLDVSAPTSASTGLGQVPALTSLRFVAAFMVMFGHTMGHFYSGIDHAGPAYAAISNFAQMGMSLFFVLSGFVISYNYTSIGSLRPEELKRFAVARVARIYPAYIAVLLFNNWMWTWKYVTPGGLVAHLTLTHDWFMDTVNGIPLISQFNNAEITWSISAEWFCYLLFPLICFALDRLRGPLLGLLALFLIWLVTIAFMTWIGHAAPIYYTVGGQAGYKFIEWLGYYSPYVRLSEFLIGCLVFRIGASLPAPSDAERRLAPLIAFIAILWLGIADVWLNLPGPMSTYGWCGGYTPGVALLIFCCCRYGGSILENKWLQTAGDASYSFYLIHTLIIVWFLRLMPAPTKNLLLATAVIGSAMAINLAISLVTYRIFERPARNAIRNAFGYGRAAVAGVA
jgi:peptidoglycan/LPS O-acetylase OafA/YrhL